MAIQPTIRVLVGYDGRSPSRDALVLATALLGLRRCRVSYRFAVRARAVVRPLVERAEARR
jgi:hypothetical protein